MYGGCPMQNRKSQLSVSTDVLEKMAQIATCEIEGVVGLSKKAIDLKDVVKAKSAFKGVKIESINGALSISVYICVKREANMRSVAEAVQLNVKDKIQAMTGTAVTKVNVIVADIDIEEPKEATV